MQATMVSLFASNLCRNTGTSAPTRFQNRYPSKWEQAKSNLMELQIRFENYQLAYKTSLKSATFR